MLNVERVQTKHQRNVSKPIRLSYRAVDFNDASLMHPLERAFDILFEETLRRLNPENKTCGKVDIDRYVQFGVPLKYEVYDQK